MIKIKQHIAVIILLFINFLFFYKYSSRYIDFGLLISVALLAIQYFIYTFRERIKIPKKQLKIFSYVLFSFIIGIVVISYLKIPVESLNVDRWSVISVFWEEAFKGNYPYFAKSNMNNYPGPMPFYFLIALPFHIFGELSLLSCLGYCIMVYVIIKNSVKTKQHINMFLLFYLATSLSLIWEITTRSNLFTFTILVVLVLNEFTKINTKKNTFGFYVLAVLTGLMLSTRSVYILAYILFFLSSLINKNISFKRLFFFVGIAFIAFVFSFIPFIITFKNEFLTMNPFIVQSSFLIPKFYTFIFILIALSLTFLVKNKIDMFFYSGISFFISILIYALYHLINFGYEASFINSRIDISYFIFCIPFFIMYLIKSNYHQNKISE